MIRALPNQRKRGDLEEKALLLGCSPSENSRVTLEMSL